MTGRRSFSRELERDYYSRRFPETVQPYLHAAENLRAWLGDPAPFFAGKRVLDIGAGECVYTRVIAEMGAVQRIVACDLFAERMRPVARGDHDDRLVFVAGDCFQLPFADQAFDVVFGSLFLHRFPDLVPPLREIHRVLGPSGSYIGMEPSPYNPLHVYRHLWRQHSRNEYLLREGHLKVLDAMGFKCFVRYFYPRYPKLRTRFLSSCMGIVARKRPERGH